MCLGYLISTRFDDPTSAIPWVQFNSAIRRYSQKARRATPQYGTYPPSSPTPDHDASALNVVLDNNASSPSQINAPFPDGPLETSPLPTDNASVVCSSAVTSPAASTELPPSAPATISTATEMEQAAYFPKGEVINDAKDADNDNLAIVLYQPVVGTSSGHRRCIDVPTSTSLATSKAKGVVAKGVSNVPVLDAAVEHHIIEREPMLDISALMSPQLEFESVFKTCGLGWKPALRNPGPICGIPRWGASTPLRYGAWDERLVLQTLLLHLWKSVWLFQLRCDPLLSSKEKLYLVNSSFLNLHFGD